MPDTSPLYEALAELVACKKLKDEMDHLNEQNTACTDAQQLEYNRIKADYEKRKLAAWEEARRLATTGGWVLAEKESPEAGRIINILTDNGQMWVGHFDARFGQHGKGGDYARSVRGKKYTELLVVEGVVAWSYIQLPLPDLFT